MTNPPLNPGAFASSTDFSVGSLSAGAHTVKIVVDATGDISESDADGPDLTGEWMSVTQSCKGSRSNQKCKIAGSLTVKNIGNR